VIIKNRKRLRALIVVLLALLILGAIIYPFATDDRLQTSYYTVCSSKIPADFEGYKIAQVSDLHCREVAGLAGKIALEQPDIIILTGDIIDEEASDNSTSYKLIDEIIGIAPVYEVTGNHEVWYNKYTDNKYRAYLDQKGVINTDCRSLPLKKDGGEIMLTGIVDTNILHDATNDLVLQQIIGEMAPPLDTSKYNILLYHRSCQYYLLTELQPDLILSGHLHGGMIRIPFVGGLVSPEKVVFPKYDGGHYLLDNNKNGKIDFIVSRGLGSQSRSPRIFNRPELVIITLQTQQTLQPGIS